MNACEFFRTTHVCTGVTYSRATRRQVLSAAADAALEGMPTTVHEDQEALAAIDEKLLLGAGESVDDTRLFTCLLFRLLRKVLLRECSDRTRFYAEDSAARGFLPQSSILSIE